MSSRLVDTLHDHGWQADECISFSKYLIQGFLSRFQTAIHNFQQLQQQAGSAIAHPQASIDMESIQARQRYLQRQLKLLSSGIRWRRYARSTVLPQGSGPGAGAPFEACLVNELVDRCMLPIIEAAWDTGGKEVAQQVGSCSTTMKAVDTS